MPITTSRKSCQVLTQLFELVGELSEAQQLLLLKGMKKDSLTTHLWKLILDLNDEERDRLLVQLKETSAKSVKEKNIVLDQRKDPRKRCSIPVSFTSGNHTYQDYILDISASGTFIQTGEALAVGQQLSIRFCFPSESAPLIVGGEVVWHSSSGIGVKFLGIKPPEQFRISQFIRQS